MYGTTRLYSPLLSSVPDELTAFASTQRDLKLEA